MTGMNGDPECNLGEQPLARIMADRGLNARDLVAGSTEQITHNLVSRACQGRRLRPTIQHKIRDALNAATGEEQTLEQLFNY